MKTILLFCAFAAITGLKIGPEDFLVKYGYMSSRHTFSDISVAVEKFQKFAKLPVTGVLDHDTVAMMQKPRCGVKDFDPSSRFRRYAASSRYWGFRRISYKFENYNADLGQAKTRQIIAAAFKSWSDVTNLEFYEITWGGSASINIRFGSGGHKCHLPFDGKGGVLAHAFYPENGQVHFDEDEYYTDGSIFGKNLFLVAAHEFGHALGLPHSDVYEALMYPYYKGYIADFKLPVDDRGGIQALYGCKNKAFSAMTIPSATKPFQGMLMQKWTNTEGDAMHHILPKVCKYPHQPDTVKILTTFKAAENSGENIATRITGYYKAKKSGYHEFEICADDSAILFVGTSSNPADKREILKVDKPTGKDFGQCKSANASYFKAGQSYYVEAVHKEKYGEDFVKVGVREPNGQTKLITASDMKWSLTDENLRVIICKGRYDALICPQDYVIDITKAAYRFSSTDSTFKEKVKNLCKAERFPPFIDCAAPSSNRIVTKACRGKQQCILYAHDFVIYDKCSPRLYSVLDVTYKCVPKGTITDAPPTTPAPTQSYKCIDKMVDCPGMKKWGHCRNKRFKEFWCPTTCGLCVKAN